MMEVSQAGSDGGSRGQRSDNQGHGRFHERSHALEGSQNYGGSKGQGFEPRGYAGNYREDREESREKSRAYGYSGNPRGYGGESRGQDSQMQGYEGSQSLDLEFRDQRDTYQRLWPEPQGYDDDRQGQRERNQTFQSEPQGYGNDRQAPIENRQAQRPESRSYGSELGSRRENYQPQDSEPRGYREDRSPRGSQPSEHSESRGYGDRRGPNENLTQNSETQGYGGSLRSYSDHQVPRSESRNYRDDNLGSQGENQPQRSESRGYVEEPRGRRETQRFQRTDTQGYGDGYQGPGESQKGYRSEFQSHHNDYSERVPQFQPSQMDSSVSHNTQPPKQRPEYQSFDSEPRDFVYSCEAPPKQKSSDWNSYHQGSETKAHGTDTSEFGPALNFTFEDKLFVNCKQKVKTEDILQFLKSFGATSAETEREDDTALVTRVQFRTKEEAEKVFAIWHGKLSLPFQCRLFFLRTLSPQHRESAPASPKLLISGFPRGIDEFTVYDLFRTVGPIYNCSIFYDQQELGHPHVALHYIKDELNDQAISKFNGYSFQGATLKVAVTDENKIREYTSRSQEPVKAKESYRVEITGFPPGFDQDAINRMFRSVGEILNVDLDVSNNRCIITYDTAMGAYGSISRFNNHLVGTHRLTVKAESGRPASKPFASIPLSEVSPSVAPPAVPTSRDATKSRWNRPADESSGHRRRNAPSGSNGGSQYGEEKPSDSFGFNDFSFDKPQDSNLIQPTSSWEAKIPDPDCHQSAPVKPSSSAFSQSSWGAPVVESNPESTKPSWDAPVVESNPESTKPSWDSPVVDSSPNNHRNATVEPSPSTFSQPSLGAPVVESNLKSDNPSWDAPVVESKPESTKPSWDAPVVESNPVPTKPSWDAPVVESNTEFIKPSWGAPVVDSNPKVVNSSWGAPVVDSNPKVANSSWDAPVVEPRGLDSSLPEHGHLESRFEHSYKPSVPIVESSLKTSNPIQNSPIVEQNLSAQSNSWDSSVSDMKVASRNVPFNEPKPAYPTNQEGSSESGLYRKNSEPKPQESTGPNLRFKSTMDLEQFIVSDLHAPFLAILKASQPSLSDASAPTLDRILKSLFFKMPEVMSGYIDLMKDLALGAKEAEAGLKETHQYSMSDEAYNRIKRSTPDFTCNSEFLPIDAVKENVLQTLILAPDAQSYPAMASLLAKRFAIFGVQDPVTKATLISKNCSLRLMMVAYCYDDVLQDLHDKYILNQLR